MTYGVLTKKFDILLVGNWMSRILTWVFGLVECTGLYIIQILFGHDKDYYDACRIQGLLLKNTRSNGTVPYGTVTYGIVP